MRANIFGVVWVQIAILDSIEEQLKFLCGENEDRRR